LSVHAFLLIIEIYNHGIGSFSICLIAWLIIWSVMYRLISLILLIRFIACSLDIMLCSKAIFMSPTVPLTLMLSFWHVFRAFSSSVMTIAFSLPLNL